MGLLLSFSSQDLPNSLTHNLSGLGVVSSFVLLVSIYSIKARRQAKSNGGYPAPLAIPLPSYSVDPNNNSHPGSMTTTAILHHGDIARQSIKSNAKFRPSA